MPSMLLDICEQDEHPHTENVLIDASVTTVRDFKAAYGFGTTVNAVVIEQTTTPVGMKNLLLPFLTLRRGLGAGKCFVSSC